MKSDELRKKYLDFFEKRGHKVIPSASLIPKDSTVLFTTAGMQPLVPYLLGQEHSEGRRLVNIQKCFRSNDIDEVGDDTHNTFFQMLGNWSLGDYWKKESITWSFEFLTKELNIPIERLAVSCFIGDDNAPKDQESADIWESLGIKKQRIAFLPKEDNWWGPVGESGPCGPDTEIFYWKANDVSVPVEFDATNKNWVEIWNNVFMQYVKTADGKYILAEQKNVDTGMGFERTLTVLNGYTNSYQTDLFEPVMSLFSSETDERKKRIIADHARASVFLISDGVLPSNKDQGYVLRRLLRRMMVHMRTIDHDILEPIKKTIAIYQDSYDLDENKIISVVKEESEKFAKTLATGIKAIEKMNTIDGKEAFLLYETYGFPLEVLEEMREVSNRQEFFEQLKKHQDLSRTASAGMFKGGLADDKPETVRLHTAHHLLLASLQEMFGPEVKQRGSNINSERLRIDFSFDRKLTDVEKQNLQDMVQLKIDQGFQVIKREMPLEEAQKIGAQMEFGVKYGNTVSVYFIEDKNGNVISKEFCGGPHVQNTKELGKFKIIKEEASSQGVRRIKAGLE
ncbi:MAG: alanine--tRNA ligase [Candidatus Staskawiczbacteria bacterium]|nr:alanine--tRNA ligase [Candidatus Staskawiczbacteria bacterium]